MSRSARSVVTCAVVVMATMANMLPASASSGQQLWVRRYSGPCEGGSYDTATAVAVSPDTTRVFVTGLRSGSGTSYDYATVAYDAVSGAHLWGRSFNGPEDGYDKATAIGVSPDGSRVFVTGFVTEPGALNDDFGTVSYDAATGTILWTRTYDGSGGASDEASSLAVSPDGTRVFVTGTTYSSSADTDYATLAYDATTGATLWAMRTSRPGWDYPNAVAASPDGSTVFVTGKGQGDYATVAYDAATGSTRWTTLYGASGRGGEAHSLAVSPDGTRVFATGWIYPEFSAPLAHYDDYATVAYDATTGAIVWTDLYDPGHSKDLAHATSVSPDGTRVFVTGESEMPATRKDYATIAYDAATGGRLWVRRFTGLGGKREDEAYALGVSPDGDKVFVTGSSSTGYLASRIVTLAYDAVSGSTLWLVPYDGPADPADDIPTSLAVSPDGARLFVAGSTSSSPPCEADFTTIAYSAN
jgi:DNA-binding beta-propeller fold protein YncE